MRPVSLVNQLTQGSVTDLLKNYKAESAPCDTHTCICIHTQQAQTHTQRICRFINIHIYQTLISQPSI